MLVSGWVIRILPKQINKTISATSSPSESAPHLLEPQVDESPTVTKPHDAVTWRIIPDSKWLIPKVSKSPKDRVSPVINGA